MVENNSCPYNARREAHDFLRSETRDYPTIPEILPEYKSPEAYMLDDTLKPVTSALFSELIGEIVTTATLDFPVKRAHPLTLSPWKKMRLDLQRHYKEAALQSFSDPSNAPVLERLTEFQIIRNKLRPVATKSPELSIKRGAWSAVSVMTKIMEDFELKKQSLPMTEQISQTGSNSARPLLEAIQFNELQLEVFEVDTLPKRRLPRAANTNNGFDYISTLARIPMTPGARKALLTIDQNPQRNAETLGDIQSRSTPLGCPITLIPKYAVQMWYHTEETAKSEAYRLIPSE